MRGLASPWVAVHLGYSVGVRRLGLLCTLATVGGVPGPRLLCRVLRAVVAVRRALWVADVPLHVVPGLLG